MHDGKLGACKGDWQWCPPAGGDRKQASLLPKQHCRVKADIQSYGTAGNVLCQAVLTGASVWPVDQSVLAKVRGALVHQVGEALQEGVGVGPLPAEAALPHQAAPPRLR